MALVSAVDLRALHNTSKQFSTCIKDGSTSSKGLWTQKQYSRALKRDAEPVIPSPSIFEGLENQTQHNELPTIATCAVHLEFLAVLHELRHSVLESEALDRVFKIEIVKKTVTRKGVSVVLKDDTLMVRRQVKWERYVECAVVRFLEWWKAASATITPEAKDNVRTDMKLPPIDVLMVWHSFLLNPKWFRTRCGEGTSILYRTDFPWESIHKALSSDHWTFTHPRRAATTFAVYTSFDRELLDTMLSWESYPEDVSVHLLKCGSWSLDQSISVALKSKLASQDARLLECFSSITGGIGEPLKNAVLRQQSFVDKMWDHLWIRSPALEGTIRRARDRYSNFLKLFKLYPATMFVPTLDIDLVWHTHQCSPATYYSMTLELAGKFVIHDDTIVQTKLDTGLQDTKSLYRMRFGKEYHICGCWDCQALQSALEKGGKGANWPRIAKNVSEDVAYYRAVEVARRKNEALPIE